MSFELLFFKGERSGKPRQTAWAPWRPEHYICPYLPPALTGVSCNLLETTHKQQHVHSPPCCHRTQALTTQYVSKTTDIPYLVRMASSHMMIHTYGQKASNTLLRIPHLNPLPDHLPSW